ncbi:MAG: hypothetical protein IT226_10995 [Flavobacteriales bacterium]|nr:hypothetical protein [Flavobacteriales bacterium]
MESHVNREKALTDRYRSEFGKLPSDLWGDTWTKETPAVPFVGEHYGASSLPKVLVYGSAENLNWDYPKPLSAHRNKEAFSKWKNKNYEGMESSIGNWFPWVQMTPVSDGTLLTAARYLLELHGATGFATDPEGFIGQIAVGNYGKFSLTGRKNADYASKPKLLKVSDPFVKADVEELEPEIIIMPGSIHYHAFRGLLNPKDPSTKPRHMPEHIWGIYQTNAGNINRHINRQLKKNGWTEEKEREGWVREWMNHIPRNIRMGRYLDWIDLRKDGIIGT